MTALAYVRQQRETASPERLMVLLFERAHQDIQRGIGFLSNRQFAEATKSLTKAADIIVHLSSTLDHSQAPALCQQLTDVYRFCGLRLTNASLRRDVKAAQEAEVAFAPLVDAFRQAVLKAAGEKR